MPELFNEVLLPESAASSPKTPPSGVKRLLGLAPRPQRTFDECVELVGSVQQFAYLMAKRLVRDDEMPRNLILVSRVNYFVGQVLNGDVQQFLHNTQYSYVFTSDLIEALRTVGAVEHAEVMAQISAFIEKGRSEKGAIEQDKLAELKKRLEAEHLSNAKLNSRYPWAKQAEWNWGDRWSAPIYLCARYIDSWRSLRIVPDKAYQMELDQLAKRIPDLERRQKAREDARPWEKKAIERLMKLGEAKIYYTAFSARIWKEKKYWCWNFTTTPGQSGGHHQAMFVDGELIVFMGKTDEILARAPAPECAVGSAVARNEPGQAPDGLHPNLILKINND
jgi:hypothetical protein